MRVTTSMIFNTSLAHLQRQQTRLLQTQEETLAGKRVQRPSDDPATTRTILRTREQLATLDQFGRNRETITSLLEGTEDALDGVSTVLQRAKELAIAGASDGLNAADRDAIAHDIAELFSQTVQLGNSDVSGRYLFAGQARNQPPVTSDGRFTGDGGTIRLALHAGQSLEATISGTTFLASSIRPSIDATTPLSSLRQGQGIALGTIALTDRAGNAATVDLSTAVTVGDVISAISGASGVNVNATLNAAGDGLSIVDTNAGVTGNLSIADVGAGTTASELGIAVSRPGTITGTALNPQVLSTTPLALLRAGQGVTPGSVHIANGTQEVDVDLSTAVTVDDVLTAINASGANVTATVNADGTALDVVSNDATTVAVVTDLNGGSTAADLGVQGGHDVLKTLNLLQTAFEQNDRQAIDRLLQHIDAGLEQVISLRGDIGARLNRVDLVAQTHADLELTLTSALSRVEDADPLETLTRFTQLSASFEAALGATARLVQPSLLDFLR